MNNQDLQRYLMSFDDEETIIFSMTVKKVIPIEMHVAGPDVSFEIPIDLIEYSDSYPCLLVPMGSDHAKQD